MNDDLIERAAQVVRERYDGESQLAARSEERILLASHRRSPRRRRPAVIAIPLVAALLASAAWATVGDKLRALVHSIDSASSVSLHPAPKPSGHLRLPPRLPPERVAPPLEPTAPLLEPSAPASATPIARAAQHAPAVGKAASLPPPPLPAPSPNFSELEITEMYRAAHHAQFAGGDPGRALELWDRYLSAAPNGSLSPEARYNRAIALARLGRKAEARSALEPFARGDYGGYRKSEAASLLELLRPGAAP